MLSCADRVQISTHRPHLRNKLCLIMGLLFVSIIKYGITFIKGLFNCRGENKWNAFLVKFCLCDDRHIDVKTFQ